MRNPMSEFQKKKNNNNRDENDCIKDGIWIFNLLYFSEIFKYKADSLKSFILLRWTKKLTIKIKPSIITSNPLSVTTVPKDFCIGIFSYFDSIPQRVISPRRGSARLASNQS